MITIFPQNITKEQLKNLPINLKNDSLDFFIGNNSLFFSKAKEAMHYLAKKFNLNREDQVAIFTSSNNSYVSTCVSATFFNYCGISRVLNKNTKFIYVIHEFGKLHPDTMALRKMADEMQVVMIEDCAHTIDSFNQDFICGRVGDYAIYSLPKVFPMKNGGILVGNDLKENVYNHHSEIDHAIKKEFIQLYKHLQFFTLKRKENYNYLKGIFENFQIPFEFSEGETPYFFILKDKYADEIFNLFDNKLVEFGRTYIQDWLCIPIHPFNEKEEYLNLHNRIKNEIK